mgnify:CR=1 FL=1
MFKRLLLCLIVTGALFGSGLYAQKIAVPKSKEHKQAKTFFDTEEYLKSWQLYKKILRSNSSDEFAAVYAAMSADRLNYAIDSSFFLLENLQKSGMDDAKYYLAKIKHKQKKFDEALSLLEMYTKVDPKKRLHSDEEANHLMNYCKNAKTLMAQPHSSVIKNMGKSINSAFDDYVPVIAPDESELYFTSKRSGSTGNSKNGDNSYFEDVYVARQENGEWKMAENIGYPINSSNNDACVAISPDGHRMIVYRTAEDGISGDLYITEMGMHHRWEPLVLLGPEINSEFLEASACFSRDTAELYFTSNRPGGYGGKDIYRIRKLPNGKWAAPFNLGPNVNTPFEEDAPFLHPDGVTLYFSSTGHNSMGEYDIFKSVWSAENNEFSKAENLGYPINDVNSDIFFVLSADGQRGYYSSEKPETNGGIDLYQIDTRFGDNDLFVKQGYTYLGNTAASVRITLIEKESNEEVGHYQSNPTTGKFVLVLNPMKAYHIILEEDGYETIEEDLFPVVLEKSDEKLRYNLKKSNAK